MRMSPHSTAKLVAALLLPIGTTFLLTRAYYDVPTAPVVRFSRQLDVFVGDDFETIKSPFPNKQLIQEEIRSRLTKAVQDFPEIANYPGIRLQANLKLCRNGKTVGSNFADEFYLRKVGDDSFEFHQHPNHSVPPGGFFARSDHEPGSISSCVDFYWEKSLSELIRDHTLDSYAEFPDYRDSWENDPPVAKVSFTERVKEWKEIFRDAFSF